MAVTAAKVEQFRFTSNDPGIVAANGAANTWSDMWVYQVQKGNTLILKNGDPFSGRDRKRNPAPEFQLCRVRRERARPDQARKLARKSAPARLFSQ